MTNIALSPCIECGGAVEVETNGYRSRIACKQCHFRSEYIDEKRERVIARWEAAVRECKVREATETTTEDTASTEVDWELRRYEISKGMLHAYAGIVDEGYAAKKAVQYADALIRRLKR